MNSADRPVSRRGFFVAVARGAAAAALAAVGAALAMGRGGQRLKEDPCLRMGVCRGCGRLAGCGLPNALMHREARGEGETPRG